MSSISLTKKAAMLAREKEWERMNFCKDDKGQAHFPTYPLGPSEMDPSSKKKGR